MIEEVLQSLLSANSDVQSQLSNRIFPDEAPSGTAYPLATFFRVDQSPFSGLYQDTEWLRSRVQFTVYAETRKAARQAAKALSSAISRTHGTYLSHWIDDIKLIQERDSFASDPHPAGYSAVELDFETVFKEPQ